MGVGFWSFTPKVRRLSEPRASPSGLIFKGMIIGTVGSGFFIGTSGGASEGSVYSLRPGQR